MTLIMKDDSGNRWYPIPIDNLAKFLSKKISKYRGFTHAYALRRNVAYNLQYLEFLDKCLSDLKMSSVLMTQTYKTFIIVGCGIIESLLTYFLIKSGHYRTTEWTLDYIVPGQKKVGNKVVRIDCHVYTRLQTKQLDEMDFDSMLKKAEDKEILGSDHSIYAKLKYLRKLRNRVHLQLIDNPTDTDWNAFNASNLHEMGQVIYAVFTGNIFHPSKKEQAYFDYLEKYI